MEYQELVAEVNDLPAEERRKMKKLVQLVGSGSAVNPRYECILGTTHSASEFFDALYHNEDVRLDHAWADVAHTLHPDWFDQFQFRQVEHDVPLKNGQLELESTDGKGNIAVPVPGDYETVDVFLFDDGQINEYALRIAGVYEGSYRIAGIQVDGRFSVGTHGNRVVIVKWILDEDGFRVSMQSKFKISCSLIVDVDAQKRRAAQQ